MSRHKKLNYFCIIVFFIIFSLIFEKIFYSFINNWSLGEWLINYEGGFVRRGLFGQIFQIYENPGHIVNVFQKVVIFLFFTSILIYLFLERNKSLLLQFTIILLFCSGGIVDFLTSDKNFEYLDRKEILFYLILMSLLLLKYFFPLNSYTWIISCAILSSLMILTHELFAVYFVPSLYFIIFLNNLNNKKFLLSSSLLYLIPTIFVFLLVFINNGSVDTVKAIFESYKSTDVEYLYKVGSGLKALAWTFDQSHKLSLRMFELGSIYPWFFYLFFNLFICIFLSYSLNDNLKKFLISNILLLLSILGFVVAAYSGWDWGRFISMSTIGYAILICINFSTFKIENNFDENEKLIFDKFKIMKFMSFRCLLISILMISIVVLSISTTMPHYGPQKSLTFF